MKRKKILYIDLSNEAQVRLLECIEAQPWGRGNAFIIEALLAGLKLVEQQSAAIDEAALRRVIREELDAALAHLAIVPTTQETEAIENEIVATALDGGMPWD